MTKKVWLTQSVYGIRRISNIKFKVISWKQCIQIWNIGYLIQNWTSINFGPFHP